MAFASAKLKEDYGKNTLKNLPKLMLNALEEYNKKEKKLPENVILYRLGLGEG